MTTAKELIFITGKKKTLVYNYYVNKMCIVNNHVYKLITENSNYINACISDNAREKLLKNGVLVRNNDEYKRMDYYPKYLEKCNNRQFDVKRVYLHVTQNCNLRCDYCYNSNNLGKHVRELSYDEICDILNDFRKTGGECVVLTGGEPLLRGDIIDICRFSKNSELYTEILTNGTCLGEKSEILENIDSMIVSLDTTDEDNNQRKGLLVNQLIRTLKEIPSYHRQKISIRSVISKRDLEGWNSVKRFCDENGYRFLGSLFTPNNETEIDLIPDISIPAPCDKDVDLGGKYCGAGFREIAIDSNGEVYPCQALVKKEFRLAESFSTFTAMNKKIKGFMNRRLTDNLDCRECNYKYLCGGGCPSISYNLYQSITEAPLPFCKHYIANIIDNLRKLLDKYDKE